MVEQLTDEQIEIRLNTLEAMIHRADAKKLPALNAAFQRLLDEQVRRDQLKLEAALKEDTVQ